MSSLRSRGTASKATSKAGNGRAITAADTSLEARIGKKIRPQPDGCWLYGSGDIDYPSKTLRVDGKVVESIAIHRFMYFTMNRLEPCDYPDHHVHHECENKRCVNPAHLALLTASEHAARHVELRQAAG